MLGDFGKELPEDTHLVDLLDPEIPGLSAPPDRASFDFVTSEVCAQLGHQSFQKQEDILTLLRGYEDTVFEKTPPKWQENDLVSGGHGPAWPSWELAWTTNWVDRLRTSADH